MVDILIAIALQCQLFGCTIVNGPGVIHAIMCSREPLNEVQRKHVLTYLGKVTLYINYDNCRGA